MTAGFVEQDASRAAREDHGQVTRRSGTGLELRDGLTRGAPGGRLDDHRTEQLESSRRRHRPVARLHPGIARGDTGHVESSAYLMVRGEEALGVGDDEPTRGVA